MKRGDSILIHAGTGGVGQAAITIALYYECEIFTTVGTAEKREFIKTHFPQVRRNLADIMFIFDILNGLLFVLRY